jgi:hypothetical protein
MAIPLLEISNDGPDPLTDVDSFRKQPPFKSCKEVTKMLDKNELLDWCQSVNLSEEARTVLDVIRTSDPARRVSALMKKCRNMNSCRLDHQEGFETERLMGGC